CNLSHKGVGSLSFDDFTGLPNLRELNLQSSSLNALPVNIFAGLPNLRELNLSRNNLSSLPKNVFAGLSNLEILRLDDNHLSSLRSDVFAGFSNLQRLYLSSNRLSSLPEDIFADLSKLSDLYLLHNNLSNLRSDVFAGLSNLQILSLNDNRLSSLPENVFADLSSLTTLTLNNNDLVCLPHIPPSARSQVDSALELPRCYALVLSPSAITTVEGGTSTYTVGLTTNPVHPFFNRMYQVTVTVSGMGSGVTVDTDSTMSDQQTTLVFTANVNADWYIPRTVTITAATDNNASSEAVTLTHTTTSGSSHIYSVSKDLEVTVIDNDTPNLVVSPAALTVAEAGSATYTVKLVKEPTADVTVTMSGMGSGVSVDADPGMVGEQTMLAFTTSNWDRSQTVTVRAAADDNAIFETVTVSHTAD
ncbi:MAG: hypothetical protein TH68_02370, partial [Candidatus Synechococcus spongiarum 142]